VTYTPNVGYVGADSFTFRANDGALNSAPAAISITVNAPLVVTTASLPTATQGVFYTTTMAKSGGQPSYTWSVSLGSLPTGLTLSSAGVLSGIPSGSGVQSAFRVRVTDGLANTADSGDLVLTITASPLNITTASLPDGTDTVYYSATLAASGG